MEAKDLIRRFESARAIRYNWENHWQEVADLVLPTREFNYDYSPGEKRRNRVYSDVAPEAAETLAAALSGMLTNTSVRWFSLVATDDRMKESQAVSKYLYDTTQIMLDYFDSQQSGFSVASHEMYLDIVTFGTGVMQVMDSGNGIRFQAKPLSAFYIVEDDNGEITESYRVFKLPAREAYDTFGDGLHPETIRGIEEGKYDRSEYGHESDGQIEFVHAILKRLDRDVLKLDSTNMPYASYYVEKGNAHLISEGGFKRMPYLFPRWSKAPAETYGRSPAMKVLPGIKVANAMARTILEAAELAIRPPVMMPANSIEGPLRTTPGSLIYYRQGTRDQPRPLISGANPAVGEGLLQRQEARIERAFFMDKFKLPDSDRMTATEIIQRRQEGLLQAAPILSRLYAEFLDPLIALTYEKLAEKNMLPAVPQILEGKSFKVEYRSPMASSKRSAHVQSFLQAMQAATPLLQVNPNVVQNLNSDVAFRDIFNATAVDPMYLKPQAEVDRGRQQKQQQQAELQQAQLIQQKAQAAQASADTLKTVQEARQQ